MQRKSEESQTASKKRSDLVALVARLGSNSWGRRTRSRRGKRKKEKVYSCPGRPDWGDRSPWTCDGSQETMKWVGGLHLGMS